jgi:hypothetical protein
MTGKHYALAGLILLAGLIAGYFIYQRNQIEKVKPDLQQFAISDPASIDKIFLTRKGGKPVILQKKGDQWLINDEFRANDQKVDMLLNQTAAKLAVMGPVPKTARNNVISRMASLGTKTEFWSGQKLVKTYYVGGTTPDQLGTYMWIEGAKDPYIVHIPGFTGYLNSRYILDQDEWLSKELFKHENSEILKVGLEYPAHPEWSFEFKRKDGSVDITVDGINEGKKVNTSALLGYFGLFNGVYCEGYPKTLEPERLDSLRKATPYCILTITDKKNRTSKLQIHKKEAGDNMYNLYDKDGNQLVHDPERFYAFLNDDLRVMYIQDLVFKNILITYKDFWVQ